MLIEEKKKETKKLRDYSEKVMKAAEKSFACDVGGGPALLMDKFFPSNGLYRVSDNKFNPENC